MNTTEWDERLRGERIQKEYEEYEKNKKFRLGLFEVKYDSELWEMEIVKITKCFITEQRSEFRDNRKTRYKIRYHFDSEYIDINGIGLYANMFKEITRGEDPGWE